MMIFTRRALETEGFVGWLPFAALRSSMCPVTAGVYVVTHDSGNPAAFAEKNCGGWFKGRDPSISHEALAANWVDGSKVVYIGKADVLRRRLRQFADFGAGKAIGHWGGRLIWQLANVADLRVAWKETPHEVPRAVEANLSSSSDQFTESRLSPTILTGSVCRRRAAFVAFNPTPKAGKGTPLADFDQHPIHQPTLTKAAQSEITSVYAIFGPFGLIGLEVSRRAEVLTAPAHFPRGQRDLQTAFAPILAFSICRTTIGAYYATDHR
ncbi:hypothetical protein O7B34_03915 [Mesorhizobium sp. Cs1299R1N3]